MSRWDHRPRPSIRANLTEDHPMRIAAIAILTLAAWCGPAAAQNEKPKPLSDDEANQLAALIKQLDSKQFPEREKATKDLAYFGIRGLETLEKAAAGKVKL